MAEWIYFVARDVQRLPPPLKVSGLARPLGIGGRAAAAITMEHNTYIHDVCRHLLNMGVLGTYLAVNYNSFV